MSASKPRPIPEATKTNIGVIVKTELNDKMWPLIDAMPRKQAAVMLQTDGSNVPHALSGAKAGNVMLTLPQIERYAALVGLRIDFKLVKDSTICEKVLGTFNEADFVPLQRGRKPLTAEQKAERAAAKPAKAEKAPKPEKVKAEKVKPEPKAKPVVKKAPTTKATAKAPAKAVTKTIAPKATKPKVKAVSETVAPAPKPAPKKAPAKVQGF